MKTFVETLVGIRHWFRLHNMQPRDDDPPIKIAIEVPTPRVAAAVLYQLKMEFEPMSYAATSVPIDFDRPMKILGFEVEFKIRDRQPMPAVYRHRLPTFAE